MADYKAIKGHHLQSVSSDNATIQLGDIWYNSTLGKIRVGKATAAAWASGGNMNTARESLGGAGTQTAGLGYGGLPQCHAEKTESYDGSSWTEVSDLNTARAWLGAAGISTAGLAYGGESTLHAVSELWNGSGWTEVGDLNSYVSNLMKLINDPSLQKRFSNEGQHIYEKFNYQRLISDMTTLYNKLL